jgi:hypothetical protein
MRNKYAPTTEFDELVQLHVHSNDGELHSLVNAVRWFENSTDDEIAALLQGERTAAGHFIGDEARTVALELVRDIDIAIILAYAKFEPERYTAIVDKLTTARWIRKHRPSLMGLLVPQELLASLPAIAGEQPGAIFLDDLSSLVWNSDDRTVRHFNFQNQIIRQWKPDDEQYESILDLFVEFPLPRN